MTDFVSVEMYFFNLSMSFLRRGLQKESGKKRFRANRDGKKKKQLHICVSHILVL